MNLLQALRSTPKTESRFSFSDYVSWLSFNGNQYPLGLQTTMSGDKAEEIHHSFTGYVQATYAANGVIFGLEAVRFLLFSEARFQFRQLRNGRPGDLFGNPGLALLETPWEGGTTGDLLAKMILHADFAGNWYGYRDGSYVRTVGEIVSMSPEKVKIVLEPRVRDGKPVGMRRFGYVYQDTPNAEPVTFLPNEVAHFAPTPDPTALYKGMSWITPVIREIQADTQATKHKLKFFENAATPNLAVSLKEGLTPEQFQSFIDKMEASHRGVDNAYRTLYTANGADVTVVGADLKQLDFKATQGAGETRLAVAAGVPPVIAGLSEGLAGSSLNAGNYGMARRRLADGTLRPLWRNACGSLSTLVPPPATSELWFDDRDIAFLREDMKDSAEIQSTKAQSIRTLTDGGYTPDSVVAAIEADDFGLLEHTGLLPVQMQPPGASTDAA